MALSSDFFHSLSCVVSTRSVLLYCESVDLLCPMQHIGQHLSAKLILSCWSFDRKTLLDDKGESLKVNFAEKGVREMYAFHLK